MNMSAPNPFLELWALGYTALVPIIPPGAPVSTRSALAKRIAAGDDARGKSPGVKWPDGSWSGFDWITHRADERDLGRWNGMKAGAGIKTGNGLVAIDADATSEAHAAAIEAAIEQRLGHLPKRIGRFPKAVYLCRTHEDFPYTRVEFGALNEKGSLDQRVEILSAGRQFVAYGTHPGTGRPYKWTRRLPPLAELPYVEPETLSALLDHLSATLPAASKPIREGAKTNIDQARLTGPLPLIAQAAENIPNTTESFPSRESYLAVGYAIKAALPEHPAEALAIYEDWCAKWTGGVNAPDVVRGDWARMKGPFRRGADWLYGLAEAGAKALGGTFNATSALWFEPLAPEPEPLFGPEPAEAALPKIAATPYEFPDPASIPKRESLYAGHYVRQFVSATVAPSKVGKSSLAIAEALAMATGLPLLGVTPQAKCRVWLWNGEDPIEELQRRVAATMLHYGITREMAGGRLFVDTGRRMPIVLAEAARDGAKIAEPVVRDVIATIQANRIDAMIVDPFVSSHRVSENDNNAIDLVAKKWAYVADVCRCSVELIHHVRKLNGNEVTVEDGRGAIALIAASRSARALARMTKAEGAKLGLAHVARRLFRFADTSSNLALPAVDEAEKWLELCSVGLGNGGARQSAAGREAGVDAAGREAGVDAAARDVVREDMAREDMAREDMTREDVLDAIIDGDSVGVVRVFDMPAEARRVMEDVSGPGGVTGVEAMTREAAAMAELASGEWRADVRAGDAWAGVPVIRAYGLDSDDPNDRARAKAILKTWIAAGKLRETTRLTKARQPKSFIETAPNSVQAVPNEALGLFD